MGDVPELKRLHVSDADDLLTAILRQVEALRVIPVHPKCHCFSFTAPLSLEGQPVVRDKGPLGSIFIWSRSRAQRD
jgi:hypothetical protein